MVEGQGDWLRVKAARAEDEWRGLIEGRSRSQVADGA